MEIAQESSKIQKAREKLLQQWAEEKGKITPKAIEETVDKIHKWIADNAKNRIQIKGKKCIELFNQNKDAALISKKVQTIADQLKVDMAQFGRTLDLNVSVK